MSALTMQEFSRMMEEDRSELVEALHKVSNLETAEELAEIKAVVLASWGGWRK
jgi:hypothetical protein